MNLIVLGPQGSGKGTQAKLLAEKYNLDHFDTGKALRQVSLLDTPLGKEVYDIVIVKKELVPSRILKEVLQFRLNDLPREQGIVFDGIPRNLEQALYFREALREFGRKIDKVIFVDISREESIERISRRFACEDCKEAVALKEREAPICPKCSGKLTQRADDTRTGVEKRLQVFRGETLPVIEFFEKEGLVLKINGEQKVEKVFAEILEKITL
ncbi:MAG: nucleoside monophosphate kinase [Candidatus Moraniibacteriota bacterium]